MTNQNSEPKLKYLPFIYYGLIILSLISSILIINQIFFAVLDINIPFDTDEADHANAGLEIYWHATKGSLSSLFTAICNQSFYPPLHGIVVAICYKILGITLFSSRVSSVVFLFLSALVLTYSIIRAANIKLKSTQSIFALSLILSLMTSNEIFLENSALCMLEIQGILLCSCILLLTTIRMSLLSCVSISLFSFLLFLTKYNYGIFIIPALAYCYILQDKRYALVYITLTTALTCIWLNVTNLDSFAYFLTGHPSYAPMLSKANLLFEVKSWLFEYHRSIPTGVIITLLAFLPVLAPHKSFTHLFCIYGVVGTLVILLLSTTNETRHFIIAAPLMWFMAVSFLVKPDNNSTATQVLRVILLILTIHSSVLTNAEARKLVIKGMEGHPTYDQAITYLVQKTDPSIPTLVIGNHDKLSIEAIQWYQARQSNLPYSSIKFDSFPFDSDKVANAIKRGRNSDDWFQNTKIPSEPYQLINSGHYKQILIFRRIGSSDEKAKLIKFFTDLTKKTSIQRKIFGSYEAIYIRL